MIDKDAFFDLLARRARKPSVSENDVLFRTGLNLGSLMFAEFLMEIEDEYNLDIEISDLDASIVTVGQLYAKIDEIARDQSA